MEQVGSHESHQQPTERAAGRDGEVELRQEPRVRFQQEQLPVTHHAAGEQSQGEDAGHQGDGSVLEAANGERHASQEDRH